MTGLGLMAIGLVGLSRIGTGTSLVTAGLVLAVFGIGFGLVTQVLTIAIQNAVDRRDLGIATASANLFRALGGSFGVALFGSVFASRLGTELEEGLARLSGLRPLKEADVQRIVGLMDPPPSQLAWYRAVLTQGWKRQLRRMFAAVGAPVDRLIRIRIGPVRIDGLRSGRVRSLKAPEVRGLAGGGGRSRTTGQSMSSGED